MASSAANDLKMVHLPARPVRQWRSLILYRHKLVGRRTAVKNSIRAILPREGRPMGVGRSGWSAESLAGLRELARPAGECPMDELWRGHLRMELDSLDHLLGQVEALDGKLDALGAALDGVAPALGPLAAAGAATTVLPTSPASPAAVPPVALPVDDGTSAVPPAAAPGPDRRGGAGRYGRGPGRSCSAGWG